MQPLFCYLSKFNVGEEKSGTKQFFLVLFFFFHMAICANVFIFATTVTVRISEEMVSWYWFHGIMVKPL